MPNGTEKAYYALRLANQLGKAHENVESRIFLMTDAAACAVAGLVTPNGYYNIEQMLKFTINKGGKVKICGSCADARRIKKVQLVGGAEISSMAEFTSNKDPTF